MTRNYDKMHEKHGNPRMRPSVDMLISKMRKMSMLQDKPDAVLEVIHDMMYTYFVKRQQRPWELHRLTGMALLELQMLIGNLEENKLPSGPDVVILSQLAEIAQTTTGSESLSLKVTETGVGTGGNAQAQLWPSGNASSQAENTKEFFKDQNRKEGVQKVIEDHVPNFIGGMRLRCKCSRIYEDQPEWANHLRIRIWRYLLNEFKSDAES